MFWNVIAEKQITFYADKVPTDSNVSDGVSRHKLEEAEACGWDRVHIELPKVLDQPLKKYA